MRLPFTGVISCDTPIVRARIIGVAVWAHPSARLPHVGGWGV
jgi:hypothetical protein